MHPSFVPLHNIVTDRLCQTRSYNDTFGRQTGIENLSLLLRGDTLTGSGGGDATATGRCAADWFRW